jgi:hypothetical protein
VLQYHFTWKVLSAAAGISWWNFYFRLYPGTIRTAQVIDFLGHLLRHLHGKLLVVWDGLPAHRARLVTQFIAAQRGRLAVEQMRLRPGTESGGIHLGLLETSRTTQLLPSRLPPAQLSGKARFAPYAAPSTAGAIVLTSSSVVTIICRPQLVRSKLHHPPASPPFTSLSVEPLRRK